MRQAMALGADVVGGIPWIESTDADRDAHVAFCFDLAREFGKDVSMLVDDAGDAGLRTLEAIATAAIERGWQRRALAHHARAMALYATPHLEKVIALMKRADLGLVTDPHTGPLHARVLELLAGGVNVCLGQDDIARLRQGSNLVLLEPEVAAAFPSADAVNEALRGVLNRTRAVRGKGGLPNKALQPTSRPLRRAKKRRSVGAGRG